MDPTYCITQMSPVRRKVLGDLNNGANSPISPTANLKLLTKVAAARFDSIENATAGNYFQVKTEVNTPPHSKVAGLEPIILNGIQSRKGVRKFKSLGFLCEKFLKLFPLDVSEEKHSQILLTKVAQHLGVEKRRVYDIINVVEGLQMATKVGKNMYTWSGRLRLVDTLSHLKTYAEQTGLMEYVRMQQFNRKLYTQLHTGEIETTETPIFSENSSIANFFRNERRIGVLCQKFVMIFLVSLQEGVVNLDLAADVLMGEHSKMRLRRLYDIANILVSLGIIEKVDVSWGWKKPAFRYVGPPVLSHKLDEINIDSPLLRKLMIGEITENLNSDFSEDSSEICWNQDELVENTSVTQTDHSYSLHSITSSDKPVAVVEPAAKKRLVFSTDVRKMVVQSSLRKTSSSETLKPLVLNSKVEDDEQCAVNTESSKAISSFLRVVGHGSVPQPIQHGAVYKAVKIGNDIQLIRIDEA